MKSKNIKILALVVLVAIGGLYLHNSKKNKNKNGLPSEVANSTPEKPFVLEIPSETDIKSSIVYDGSNFIKYTTGPLIKTKPVVVTKEEFLNEYQNYLL